MRVLSVMAQNPGEAPPDAPVPSAPLDESDRVAPWPEGTLATQRALDAGARAVAQRAVELLASAGVTAEAFMREGDPGREIVAAAREWPAEWVVLGSHDHGKLKRLLLGSTASYVATHAPCSVTIVRAPA